MPDRRAALADVYSSLKAVMVSLGRRMETELAQDGMSIAQMILLYRLVEGDGPTTPKSLAKALGVTPGNVTRLVEKLEALGYASRTRSQEDLRVVFVRATAAGAAAIEEGYKAQAKVLTMAFGDWPDDEVRLLRQMLRRLVPETPRKAHAPAAKRSAARPPRLRPAQVASAKPTRRA